MASSQARQEELELRRRSTAMPVGWTESTEALGGWRCGGPREAGHHQLFAAGVAVLIGQPLDEQLDLRPRVGKRDLVGLDVRSRRCR